MTNPFVIPDSFPKKEVDACTVKHRLLWSPIRAAGHEQGAFSGMCLPPNTLFLKSKRRP
jgi:hypothetical protein